MDREEEIELVKESYRLLIKLMEEFEKEQKYYLRTTRYSYFKQWVLNYSKKDFNKM